MKFTVWETSAPEWFNYERTVKRNGTAKNTIEADTPAIAAEQYAAVNMQSWQSDMHVIVCDDSGKTVLTATVVPKVVRTFEVRPL